MADLSAGGREYYTDAALIGDSTSGDISTVDRNARAIMVVNTGSGSASAILKDEGGNTVATSALISAGTGVIITLNPGIAYTIQKGGLGGPITAWELY